MVSELFAHQPSNTEPYKNYVKVGENPQKKLAVTRNTRTDSRQQLTTSAELQILAKLANKYEKLRSDCLIPGSILRRQGPRRDRHTTVRARAICCRILWRAGRHGGGAGARVSLRTGPRQGMLHVLLQTWRPTVLVSRCEPSVVWILSKNMQRIFNRKMYQ